jgi:hypothetical protein
VSAPFLRPRFQTNQRFSAINFALAVICIPFTMVLVQQVPHYRDDSTLAVGAPAEGKGVEEG